MQCNCLIRKDAVKKLRRYDMKFYIADAFTEKLFGGNPAGVVLLDNGTDFPADEIMKKTAAELRYSETAFIKKISDTAFNIRYFTPAGEVDLCGHATIASFRCLLDAELVKKGCTYTNKTLAGNLEIEVNDNFIMMEMASPHHISTIKNEEEITELYHIMGINPESVMASVTPSSHIRLFPMLISTGLPDIMMPVASKEKLNDIRPDFPRLAKLSEKYSVTGVHAFALNSESDDITAYCRNFAPLYDIDEEAATGTANGALTYYLYKHGLINSEDTSTFMQGESMDRPSTVISHISETSSDINEVSIHVGGNAAILAKGDIYI